MRAYSVFLIDRQTGVPVQAGSILEFRRARSVTNRLCLTRLAQKLFASGTSDIVYLGPECFPETTAETEGKGRYLPAVRKRGSGSDSLVTRHGPLL